MNSLKSIAVDAPIELRVRFTRFSAKSAEDLVTQINLWKSDKNFPYPIKQTDEHIWIEIPKQHKKMHSPHLHLELFPKKEGTEVAGLFGPDPSLWTMFMFLHFFLALVFIILGIWGYSSWSLGKEYLPQLLVMGVIGLIWAGLYFFARYNRNKGKAQAKELEEIMNQLLN